MTRDDKEDWEVPVVSPKPQPTIRGYVAWAFKRLQRRKRLGRAETAAWIIERWLDEDPQGYLAKRGITYEAFLEHEGPPPGRVLAYSKESGEDGEDGENGGNGTEG